jgi:L,D-transpeptidase ErfK/SrfK
MAIALVVAALLTAGATARGNMDPPSRLTGGVRTYVVGAGETLRSIGSRTGIDPRTITHDNSLKSGATLKPGTEILLDNRHIAPIQFVERTIVINVPQRMLFYADDTALLAFPVAVGSSGWRTPLAAFSVREKELNPTWDVPPSIAEEARQRGKFLPARVPPGPANPLGRHYLALSIGNVGVHGTNAPTSIYQPSTHGCIRVHPDDVEALFGRVEVGTPGLFVYEPVLLAIDGREIFLEVHPDVYRRARAPLVVVRELADQMGIGHLIDWTVAERVAADRHGLARSVSLR